MMKWLLHIAFVLFALPAAGQQPALLSIEGFGGESYEDVNQYVSKTPDGGFIVHIGTTSQTGNLNSGCTVTANRGIRNKYDSNGQLQWQECAATDPDSNYFIHFPLANGESIWGGTTTLNVGRDFLICRKDINGNKIWAKRFGGSNDEMLRDMIESDDGGYIMYGISYSSDGDVGLHYGIQFASDLWAIKIDSNGNKLWSVVVGGSNDDNARSLSQAPGGGCYLYAFTGSWDYDCITYHGAGDALIARIGGNGNIIWTRCYGGTDNDGANGGITEDGGGGALVVGASFSTDGDVHNHVGNRDFWLFDIDSNSTIQWDNCFGGTDNNEMPYAICKASDGSIWIGGSSASTDGHVGMAYGSGDAWLVHVDAGGNYLSSKVLGTSGDDEITMLEPLNGGMIMAGGTYGASGATGEGLPIGWNGLYDIFLARFAPWTTGIQDAKIDNITIYPNPVSDKLFVSLRSEDKVTIAICDVLGNEVLRSNEQNFESGIDVSAWPRGVYYLRVTSSGGQAVRGLVLQ